MLNKILKLLALLFIIAAGYYAFAYYENNTSADAPGHADLEQAFVKSVGWLSNNYSKIKNHHNPALWWMLKEATDISDNKILGDIYNQYKTGYLDQTPPNIWTPYFDKYYKATAPAMAAMQNYRPYQVFFVYALSCDSDLAQTDIIKNQLKAGYCGLHYLSPRCVTHQLMSVRLMQEHSCGDAAQLAALSSALQSTIIDELTYDFRVTDSYLQRVLALAEAGNIEAIQPVWLQRILDAQNEDGGWDDIHPVLQVSDKLTFGWSSTLPRARQASSDFHATAQGVWLLAILLQHQQTASQ